MAWLKDLPSNASSFWDWSVSLRRITDIKPLARLRTECSSILSAVKCVAFIEFLAISSTAYLRLTVLVTSVLVLRQSVEYNHFQQSFSAV